MATDSNTLLDEAKCLGCASNSSTNDMLKLGILGRIASAYSAVQSFISRAGITDSIQIAAVLGLAEFAVAHGWWAKCDLIYPFVGGTALAHSQNLKSTSFTITWNGTVTHDANGITGNGTNGYGNTGYNPFNSGQVELNSAHIGLYRRTTGSVFFGCHCGGASGGNSLSFIRGNNNTTIGTDLNDAGGAFYSGVSSLAFIVATRNLSSVRSLFHNATEAIQASTSTSIPSDNLFILAKNNAGAASHINSNLAAVTVGSGITFAEYQLMAADWQAFQTALGRQV